MHAYRYEVGGGGDSRTDPGFSPLVWMKPLSMPLKELGLTP